MFADLMPVRAAVSICRNSARRFQHSRHMTTCIHKFIFSLAVRRRESESETSRDKSLQLNIVRSSQNRNMNSSILLCNSRSIVDRLPYCISCISLLIDYRHAALTVSPRVDTYQEADLAKCCDIVVTCRQPNRFQSHRVADHRNTAETHRGGGNHRIEQQAHDWIENAWLRSELRERYTQKQRRDSVGYCAWFHGSGSPL